MLGLRRSNPSCVLRATTALLMVAAGVVCTAVPARAEYAHEPLFQLAEIPAEGPHGERVALPEPLRNMEAMTVDSGHLWVAEDSYGNWSRVDEFDAASGAFIAQPVAYEAHYGSEGKFLTGYGEGYGTGIAVGHGAGGASVYLAGELDGVSVVSVLDEAGALQATWSGKATPGGTFGRIEGLEGRYNGTVTGVAVDDSTDPLDLGKGDVYVGLASGVIDVFHPEASGEEKYVGQITGTAPSEPFVEPAQIAVDEATGELFVFDARQSVHKSNIVDVFRPTGLGEYEFVRGIEDLPGRTFKPEMAVDGGSGKLYVSELAPEGYYLTSPQVVDEFSTTGAYLGHVEQSGQRGLAVNQSSPHDLFAGSQAYGPDVVIPDVTTGPVSDLQPESVTLTGTVDTDNAGTATCQFEWGTSSSLGKVVPCSKAVPNGGEGPVAVQAQLTGLERDVTYFYRLRASNASGSNPGEIRQDQQFSTTGVLIRGASILNVSATAGTLAATINPGSTPTSYYFQYGTSTAYGQDTPAAPGTSIGAGTTDVEVPTVTVRGLTPSTVYHYRVVAISEAKPGELETVTSGDYTFTTQAAGGAFELADGRQWELVSPANKLGAEIFPPGQEGMVQAAAEGDAITYRAASPTEGDPVGNDRAVTVLSARGAGGWSSVDISSPHEKSPTLHDDEGEEFQAFSEDLSVAAVQPTERVFTPLSPEASEQTAYLRSDLPEGSEGAFCRSSCYRPLVTSTTGFANVPPGTVFGEMPDGLCEEDRCGPQFIGASPDMSHVVLASPVRLTPTPAPAGGQGLYEWGDGKLQLLDVLPKGDEGPAVLAGTEIGFDSLGARHSISDDGNRVILEGGASGGEGKGLYMREVEASETLRLDAPQGGPGPSVQPIYMDASDDGSRVFFLDSGRLTANASASGADLYEYDLNAPRGSRLSDLTADPNTGQAANVAMVIGASEDGSYVYFAAAGALAPGAATGECPADEAQPGQEREGCNNLYVRHEGVTRLITALTDRDVYDWRSPAQGLQARVSPDGQWLAFLSEAELTGYDVHDAVSGQQDVEVYLYDASAGRLVCASCNPSGARPVGSIEADNTVVTGLSVAASVPPSRGHNLAWGQQFAIHQPRYLSDSGRLFFDSVDALVPKDVNGVEDVYEYEPTGTGSCTAASTTFAERSDGCVDLVSSGTSPEASEFIDASETGGDVFFRTQARLAPQDYDTAYDVYDAHECTAAVPCVAAPPAPPPCDTEASCKAAPTPQPALYGAPASATFSGAGNRPPVITPAAKSKSKPKKQGAVKCRVRSGKRLCRKPKDSRRSC